MARAIGSYPVGHLFESDRRYQIAANVLHTMPSQNGEGIFMCSVFPYCIKCRAIKPKKSFRYRIVRRMSSPISQYPIQARRGAEKICKGIPENLRREQKMKRASLF